MKPVKVAIVGFGGIARAHNVGYSNLAKEGEPIELVAVCDINPAKFESMLKINLDAGSVSLPENIHTYTDVDEMLANEDFDVADICLPTYLHCEYAVKCLRAGKHVLSEKPMALSTEQCDEMIKVAKEMNRKLMIGQCLRFCSAYLYLKDCVDSGRYGALRTLFMERLSAQPRWGFEHWFEDTERCGGCILDMHIHDVDMARFLLGEPKAVSTVALDGDVRWQIENTRLYYDGPLVVINGSWGESATSKFTAGYRASFEKATLISNGSKVTVYPSEGEAFQADLGDRNHFFTEEIRAYAHELLDGKLNSDVNPMESARETVRVIEKLRESAEKNGEIVKI